VNAFGAVSAHDGTPGLLRSGLGLWSEIGKVGSQAPESYGSSGLGLTGVAIDLGLVGRWFGAFINGAYGSGSFKRLTFNTHFALPNPTHVTWAREFLRAGPRFPFGRVALGLGALAGLQEVDIDQVRTGKLSPLAGGFLEVDVQPLCDWGLFLLGSIETSNDNSGNGPLVGLQLGGFYEPNARCRRERATTVGLLGYR